MIDCFSRQRNKKKIKLSRKLSMDSELFRGTLWGITCKIFGKRRLIRDVFGDICRAVPFNMSVIANMGWRISSFRHHQRAVAFRLVVASGAKCLGVHQSCREFSCTPVYQSRQRNVKKYGFFATIDRITIDILKKWPFLHGYYTQMSQGKTANLLVDTQHSTLHL